MISLFGKTEPEPTFLEKLRKSVSKTKAALSETVDTIFLGERRIDPSILRSPRKIVSTVSDSAAFVLLTDFLSFSRNVGSGSVFPNREIIRRALHSWRN